LRNSKIEKIEIGVFAVMIFLLICFGAKAFEIRQDVEGSGAVVSRIAGPDGVSTLQSSSGNVTIGQIFRTGGTPYQFVGIQTENGRFGINRNIGAKYGMFIKGDMFATAAMSGNSTEGGEVSVNATVGGNSSVDEELVSVAGDCRPHRWKILETEASLGENDSMVLKSKVGWP
jgi:hypothetical protein